MTLRDILDAQRVEQIRAAMAETGGRVPAAARALGVTRRTVYRWLADPRLADVARAPKGTRPAPVTSAA